MSTELAKAGIDTFIEQAIETKASPENLQKLLDMKIQYDREEARKDFQAALAAFQGECPEVLKDKNVSFKQTNYNYASLDAITKAIRPAAQKHGISWRWTNQQHESSVTVGCIVSHESGSELDPVEVTMPHDVSGNKDALKAVRSAQKYAQRCSLELALGLSTKDCDDDGAAAHPEPASRPTEEQQEFLSAVWAQVKHKGVKLNKMTSFLWSLRQQYPTGDAETVTKTAQFVLAHLDSLIDPDMGQEVIDVTTGQEEQGPDPTQPAPAPPVEAETPDQTESATTAEAAGPSGQYSMDNNPSEYTGAEPNPAFDKATQILTPESERPSWL